MEFVQVIEFSTTESLALNPSPLRWPASSPLKRSPPQSVSKSGELC
jgi:hypothetical protein